MELKSIPQTLGVHLSGKEESYVPPPVKTSPGRAGKTSLNAQINEFVSHGKRSVMAGLTALALRERRFLSLGIKESLGMEERMRYLAGIHGMKLVVAFVHQNQLQSV